MSIASNVNLLAARVAAEIKALRAASAALAQEQTFTGTQHFAQGFTANMPGFGASVLGTDANGDLWSFAGATPGDVLQIGGDGTVGFGPSPPSGAIYVGTDAPASPVVGDYWIRSY